MLRPLHLLVPDVRAEPGSAGKLTDTGDRESFMHEDDVAMQPTGLVKLDGAHVLGAPPGAATAKTLHDEPKIPPEMLQVHVVVEAQADPQNRQAGIGEGIESEADPGFGVSPVTPAAGVRRTPGRSARVRRM